jgi:hypothetical protein
MPDFPPGDLILAEEPDFLIRTPTHTIGVELTELYRPRVEGQQPLQETEQLRRRVCERAQCEFEKSGRPSLLVFVSFNSAQRLIARRVPQLVEELTSIVGSLDLQAGEEHDVGAEWDSKAALPDEVSRLRVWRPPRKMTVTWQASSVGIVATCEADHVLPVVSKKEQRLPAYLRNASEVWLIIVADGFSISSTFEAPNPDRVGEIETGFQRVYYFDNFRRKVVQLQTRPASGA